MSGKSLRGFFLKLIGLTVAALMLSAGVSRAGNVKLQWDANTEPTPKGYKIYYKKGTSGPPYDGTGASQGSSPITVPLTSFADDAHPEFTLSNINDGESYYITVTAYSDTAESGYSDEVVFRADTSSERVIDNTDADFSVVGTWSTSKFTPGYYGSNYRYVSAGHGSKKAIWTFQVGTSGQYSVSAWWPAYSNRSPDAPYTIYNNGAKVDTIRVDQRINGGRFNELGTYQLDPGTVEVVLSDDVSSGYVTADAVKLEGAVGSAPVDSDGDGIADSDEISIYKTDPDKFDSDGDGISDGAEVQFWGTDWDADPDADGLYNLLDSDADNDGYSDGIEVDGGFDPADANSSPGSQTALLIIDNTDADFSVVGTWSTSKFTPGYYGSNYRYASAGEGSKKATWTFQVSTLGQYSISAWWPAYSNRSPDAPYTIYNNGAKVDTIRVDQRINGEQFNELGTYQLDPGTVEVVLSDDISSGYVIADTVSMEPK